MALSITSLKQTARKQWRYLFQIGAWVMVTLGSFVLPPPLWDLQEDAVWFHFAHFLVSALIGLLLIPMNAWSERKHGWRWWWITAGFLVFGISLFFAYQSFRADWTRNYSGRRVVVGSKYTQDALDYKQQIRLKQQREISDERLIMDYAGDRGRIWDERDMKRRRLILAGIYIALVSALAIVVMTLVQALYCSTKPKKRTV